MRDFRKLVFGTLEKISLKEYKRVGPMSTDFFFSWIINGPFKLLETVISGSVDKILY